MKSRIFTISICGQVENPHVILLSHHQQWIYWTRAGVCRDNLFGSHVLPYKLTGQNYKAFLENNIPDFLADVSLIICQELYFTHDSAPPHFSLIAQRHLNWKFPCCWIGRGGLIGFLLKQWWFRLLWMMWKLSKIELWQVIRHHKTYQEFWIVFAWQWNVKLRPVFRQEVNIWNIYSKVIWRDECL
jgi:hypothetical protein